MSASGKRARIASRALSRRSVSSFSLTGAAPGRVEQAPRSMMSAPSASIRATRVAAAAPLAQRLPAKKLSGVALTIPITQGRASSTSLPPICSEVEMRSVIPIDVMFLSIFREAGG